MATTANSAAALGQLDHALLVAFLDTVPDRIYFKDRQGRFIAASKSKIVRHGFTHASELIGKTDFDIFPVKHAQRALADEETILRTGKPIVDLLEHVVWPDGTETWTEVSKMPLHDESGAIIGTFGISKDVTEVKKMEQALDQAHRNLVDASRVAGMAEVATGVLHNVGNVLTSLNVSTTIVAKGLGDLKAESLTKLGAMLQEHTDDLPDFLSRDPKGRRVPEFVTSLGRHVTQERDRLLAEVNSMQGNVDHIKEIVSMQQAYATMIGVIESLDPVSLLEDAIRLNSGALSRHEVRVERDFQPVPLVLGERAKILQILVNLIRNAKYACDDGRPVDKCMTLRLRSADGSRVQLIVEDNGVGIPAENLTRIFQHGFTTRATGHGFGLHSAANAAKEMKGTLSVESGGIGTGARFVLELPVAPPAATGI
jgi:PAS domain S-box-containing protein